jgi:SAM-dependent methyltransferase
VRGAAPRIDVGGKLNDAPQAGPSGLIGSRPAMSSFIDVNRASWNESADIHVEDQTGFYGIDRFLAGEDVLGPIEAAEIGDVAGLDLLHLQCHIGTDTLSLARRGARVTGLDFSANALGHARSLAARAGIEARFIEGDVYDAPRLVDQAFDMVYTTWGTITWLPDVNRWGAAIAAVLKPRGRFYFADSHPSMTVLDEIDGKLVATLNWRTPSSIPLEFQKTQTYSGDRRTLVNSLNFEWNHPVSDVLMALVRHGLTIEHVAEHEALPWAMFPMMVRGDDRLYRLPAGVPRIPLSWSIKARKP